MYEEIKNDIIKALADYYHIDVDVDSYRSNYEFTAGCTICGNDNEYRWLTLENVVEALDNFIEDIAYNLED